MESRRDFLFGSHGMPAGSAVTSSAVAADKAPIVLIHGAGYDAGSWNKVVPLLEAGGHVVVAPDMPGFGTNGTPNPDTSLDDYVEAVISAVNSVPGPVMLVGHSLGGIAISQAAERVPDKLASLTYVCAFMLRDGESRMDVASQDPNSTASKHRISAGEGLVTFTREGLVDSFCNDCSPQDVEFVLERLKPQPVKPLRTALRLTAGNYGRIPRHYIKCTLDRVITPLFQDKMIAAQPVKRSLELEASHSPFLSKPRELASFLKDLGSSK